ncbi:hypothetical protein N7451_003370 [Penicillium sp. IBT 35674x]|nr:hypothetical protein N7451_003370 [Penicillium sp. IBT 35674x]
MAQWSIDKPMLKIQLDNAKIIAVIDEVKPFSLRSKKGASTLRQMGIELLCWIQDCRTRKKPKKRYFMLSQLCLEMWIVVADCSKGYLDFLDTCGEAPSSNIDTAFLPLSIHGPFNIFSAKDMYTFGILVFALTTQYNTEVPTKGSN